MKTSAFTELKIFMIVTEKERKFSFCFIVYTPMCTITYITKQSMNVMASTFSAIHVKGWRDKNKKSANQNNLVTKMLLTFLLRKCITTLDSFAQKQRS